ncbi:MAG: LysR family transcriptional regulator [Xenococcaceae cyanobacterium]
MELRQLKYFIAVAEELHFGRAAESLHLSQPALSKQIQALEDSLKIQLLERTKHSCRLTMAGQKFLEKARRILQEVEEGIQVTRQVADGKIGRVRVGFTEATLYSLAPNIFKTYQEHSLIGNFLTLKLALAWRGDESSPAVQEFIKVLQKTIVNQ